MSVLISATNYDYKYLLIFKVFSLSSNTLPTTSNQPVDFTRSNLTLWRPLLLVAKKAVCRSRVCEATRAVQCDSVSVSTNRSRADVLWTDIASTRTNCVPARSVRIGTLSAPLSYSAGSCSFLFSTSCFCFSCFYSWWTASLLRVYQAITNNKKQTTNQPKQPKIRYQQWHGSQYLQQSPLLLMEGNF